MWAWLRSSIFLNLNTVKKHLADRKKKHTHLADPKARKNAPSDEFPLRPVYRGNIGFQPFGPY